MINVKKTHAVKPADIAARAPGGPPRMERMRVFVMLMQRWGVMIAALLTLVVYGTPGNTQTMVGSGDDARTGAVMTVPINKSQTLRVERAIGKAVIGNDDIADVLPVSLSSIYILGKTVGSTNLSLFDKKGALIAVVDIVVAPDTQGLKRKLAEMLPTELVGVTAANDSVILDGRISTPAVAERIAAIAETYAPKKVLNMMSIATATQIMLEVRFAEMSRGTVKQLGITSVNFGNLVTNATTPNIITAVGSSGGDIRGPSPGLGSYSAGIAIPALGLGFRLDALEQQGLVRTLAQPNLIALSGETASFLAGGEFPVPTGVAINGQVAIEFKEFGVGLKFTPTLLEDGLINLVVNPSVSSLDPSAGINLNGLIIPGLRSRKATTTLELRDGQAFAMAGLIQSDFRDTVNAIPLLGKIPILGALFRSTSYNRNETELVIVVTPRLVRPVKAGTALTLPTDRVQQPSDMDLFLMGNSEKKGVVVPTGPLPGPANDNNRVGTAPSPMASAVRPGGIDGEFGHIVK
jgi:pilus assembly protein CpaC